MAYSFEKIKSLIEEMYENYGLEIYDMTDYEMEKLCSYYLKNQEQLEKDLKSSRKSKKVNKDEQ